MTFALVALLLFTLILLAGGGRVWALTITPNPPVAGQPITFSGTNSADSGITVYSGFGCLNVLMSLNSLSTGPGAYSYTLAGGLPAGQYSALKLDDASPPTGCVNFTVNPAPTTGGVHPTFPIYVGAAFLAHKQYCTASPTHC